MIPVLINISQKYICQFFHPSVLLTTTRIIWHSMHLTTFYIVGEDEIQIYIPLLVIMTKLCLNRFKENPKLSEKSKKTENFQKYSKTSEVSWFGYILKQKWMLKYWIFRGSSELSVEIDSILDSNEWWRKCLLKTS